MTNLAAVQDQAIDRFWEAVPPVWGTIRSHIREVATRDFDITVEQFHVLRYVRRGTASVGELATAKNISRPAISQAVEVLVNKGMLSRVQSQGDRRFVKLALTDAGNDLLDTVFQETRQWMKTRMSRLNAAELKSMIEGMGALKKMLEEA